MFAEKVARTFRKVAVDIADEDAVHENPITGQITGRLKEALSDFSTETLIWNCESIEADSGRGKLRARQLTSQGRGSEEKPFGADVIICIEIETRHANIRKGFIVQAKRLDHGSLMAVETLDELQSQ